MVYFCFISFSGVFSCSFNWEQFLCLFILLNFLCLCEFRSVVVWQTCSYVGVSLYSLYVPDIYGGRSGFDMDVSHVFPSFFGVHW